VRGNRARDPYYEHKGRREILQEIARGSDCIGVSGLKAPTDSDGVGTSRWQRKSPDSIATPWTLSHSESGEAVQDCCELVLTYRENSKIDTAQELGKLDGTVRGCRE